jgi:hypothetical protein
VGIGTGIGRSQGYGEEKEKSQAHGEDKSQVHGEKATVHQRRYNASSL